MLQLTIPDVPPSPPIELFDERSGEFVSQPGKPGIKGQTIQLEHSLISVSKWEAKWNKPFISREARTTEETIDYIKCMTLTQNVKPELYDHLTNDMIKQVLEYIDAPMTATKFSNQRPGSKGKGSNSKVTSEIIYYLMISYEIPFECQKWHLNRLLTLIHVCEVKGSPGKKMSKKDIYKSNAAINAARRARAGSRG